MQFLNQDEKTKSPFIISDDISNVKSTITKFKLFMYIIQFLNGDGKVSLSTIDVINYFKWLHPNLSRIDDLGNAKFKLLTYDAKTFDEVKFFTECITEIQAKLNIKESKDEELILLNETDNKQHSIWERLRYLAFYELIGIAQTDNDMLISVIDNHPHNSNFFLYVKNKKVKSEDLEEAYNTFLLSDRKIKEVEKKKSEQKTFEKKVTVLLRDVIEGNHNIPGLGVHKINITSDSKK